MEIVTGEIIYVKNIGSVQLHIIVKGKLEEVKLMKIYYYPGLNLNLISLGYLKKNKICFKIENGVISAIKDKVTYFEVCRINKVYILNTSFIEIADDKFK